MESFSNMSDLKDLMRLAQTPAGQQLIALLRQQGGDRLSAAITQAAAGNYTQAKTLLSPLLETPEAQALVKSLEERK